MTAPIAWIPDEGDPPACRNHPRLHPDAWFPGSGALSPQHHDAIAVCLTCPLRDACRD